MEGINKFVNAISQINPYIPKNRIHIDDPRIQGIENISNQKQINDEGYFSLPKTSSNDEVITVTESMMVPLVPLVLITSQNPITLTLPNNNDKTRTIYFKNLSSSPHTIQSTTLIDNKNQQVIINPNDKKTLIGTNGKWFTF